MGDEVAAERLRGALVDKLRERGQVRSAAVEAAMRAVPRHRFVPDASLEQAYADDVVRLKWDGDGEPIVTASAPGVVGTMLEQSGLRPGQRVLEIGGGTGYNAALLAHLVGPDSLACHGLAKPMRPPSATSHSPVSQSDGLSSMR